VGKGLGVGVGEVTNLRDGKIPPALLRRAEEILLLDKIIIIRKINPKKIKMNLLDDIS
jgi:hypothetical protein